MISYPAMWWIPHRERRSSAALAAMMVAIALTAIAFVTASATARASAHAAKARPAVKIANTLVGPLLVNHSGRTIYMFTRDRRRKDRCRKIKGCERDWPAVTTTGKPVAGKGVKKSLLGTIPYKGKLRELTYKGYPLHTYRFDTGPGSVINIGNRQYGGGWYALTAKAQLIK
jgi:predicted lipoprotein with Yx(FWY)xxD motif